ncbi:hypothetical protein BBP00_00007258 [Phytophthora kernoviae]|uniref:PH domain-containing protein n=1 Tax=Phytophthora kernoviae TaxID=325452 RepID=A0A3F2RK80_9STRA|nr:hypothetical protein BBP00_00007258 [Phytophthora kernoviae]
MESYIDLVLEMTATFDTEGFQLPSKVTRSEVLKALQSADGDVSLAVDEVLSLLAIRTLSEEDQQTAKRRQEEREKATKLQLSELCSGLGLDQDSSFVAALKQLPEQERDDILATNGAFVQQFILSLDEEEESEEEEEEMHPLQYLLEMYPGYRAEVVEDVLDTHHYDTFFLNGCSSDATEAALREVYNLPLTQKQTPTTVDEEIEMVAVAAAATADAEEDTASRRQSQRVLASFRRGQHILAVDRVRELSQARREHREAQRQWAHEFFLAHEEHLKHQRPIDLHGMIVMEAMWVAREAIEYCQAHPNLDLVNIIRETLVSERFPAEVFLKQAQASVASAWASRNLFHFGDGTQPRGVIRVAHIDDNDRSNRIGFKVFGACGKVIDIRAHDNQERNRWLRALKTPARRKSRSWSIGSSEEVTVSMSSFDPDGLCRFDRLSIPITKSGWMEKKTSFLGIWRRYFFVVQGSMLSYYTSDKPYEVPVWRGYVESVKARRRSGSLILPSASGSVTPPPLELFITLDSPQHQVLRVRLGSMEEAREWRCVLRGNMLQNNDTAYMF